MKSFLSKNVTSFTLKSHVLNMRSAVVFLVLVGLGIVFVVLIWPEIDYLGRVGRNECSILYGKKKYRRRLRCYGILVWEEI